MSSGNKSQWHCMTSCVCDHEILISWLMEWSSNISIELTGEASMSASRLSIPPKQNGSLQTNTFYPKSIRNVLCSIMFNFWKNNSFWIFWQILRSLTQTPNRPPFFRSEFFRLEAMVPSLPLGENIFASEILMEIQLKRGSTHSNFFPDFGDMFDAVWKQFHREVLSLPLYAQGFWLTSTFRILCQPVGAIDRKTVQDSGL